MTKLVLGFLLISSSNLFTFASDLKENESFNKALEKYEVVSEAFFDSKIEEIKKKSKDLINAIDAIDNEEIKKNLRFSKNKLKEISNSNSLEKNQEAFSIVSQAFYVVLTKYAKNENYARYYCPMVKKYWLQNTKKSEGKTLNIYAAKSMPHCGGKR